MDSRPGEGVFTVSVWVSPAATGEMVGNSQRPALIARTIERLFKENKAVDLESLCIRFGEKVKVIYQKVNNCNLIICVWFRLGFFGQIFM
jgi:exosome complex RNA-binding protein Rrp42 (RNase PH superfamily)